MPAKSNGNTSRSCQTMNASDPSATAMMTRRVNGSGLAFKPLPYAARPLRGIGAMSIRLSGRVRREDQTSVPSTGASSRSAANQSRIASSMSTENLIVSAMNRR